MGAAFDELLDLRAVERGQGNRSDLTTCLNFRQVCDEVGVSRGTAYDRLKLADTYAELPEDERAAVDAGYSGPSPRWSVKASTRRVPGVRFQ